MESVKKVDVYLDDSGNLHYSFESSTPGRDAMAEVAKLIGMQPTPLIMEAQGYDWSSNGHPFTGVQVNNAFAVGVGTCDGCADILPAKFGEDAGAS